MARTTRIAAFLLPFAASLALVAGGAIAQGSGHARLLSHKATYSLALDPQKPSNGIAAADGKLEYTLEQTSCSWYRVATAITLAVRASNGRRASSASQSEVTENAAGTEMQFKTRRDNDGRQVQASEGVARRSGGRVAVRLAVPQVHEFELADDIQFPVQLLALVLDAAASSRPNVATRLYDGSDTALKALRVVAQIGTQANRAAPPDNIPRPAWPLAMGYFTDTATPSAFPEWELAAVLQQNGVYNDLRLNFREFALRTVLTELVPIPPGQCD